MSCRLRVWRTPTDDHQRMPWAFANTPTDAETEHYTASSVPVGRKLLAKRLTHGAKHWLWARCRFQKDGAEHGVLLTCSQFFEGDEPPPLNEWARRVAYPELRKTWEASA